MSPFCCSRRLAAAESVLGRRARLPGEPADRRCRNPANHLQRIPAHIPRYYVLLLDHVITVSDVLWTLQGKRTCPDSS